MLIAGDHEPLIPFTEVFGSAGITAPLQYGPTAAKPGVTLGVIVMVAVLVVAHCPTLGVNV